MTVLNETRSSFIKGEKSTCNGRQNRLPSQITTTAKNITWGATSFANYPFWIHSDRNQSMLRRCLVQGQPACVTAYTHATSATLAAVAEENGHAARDARINLCCYDSRVSLQRGDRLRRCLAQQNLQQYRNQQHFEFAWKAVPQVIQFPSITSQWREISDEFESICGFPDVAGAIGGSLFKIERPWVRGWICRKGLAAINTQATIDRSGRFIELPLRAGSCSDKNLWPMSSLGTLVYSARCTCWWCYTLSTNLLTSFFI